MKTYNKKGQAPSAWGWLLWLSLSCLVGVMGCGGSPATVHRYLLEYPPPVVRVPATLDVALTVVPFTVDEAFNSTAMLYRPSPNVSDSYRYHRWRVDPGSMATDFIIRDFRQSRLFRAILTRGSAGESRFRLEGSVEEIQEINSPGGWQAALTLSITLLDMRDPDLSTRLVFQKTLQRLEAIPEKTPAGLARGVSRAMQQLSQVIQGEVYRAARTRLRSPGKALGGKKLNNTREKPTT